MTRAALTDIRHAGVLLYGLHLAANLSKRPSTTDSRHSEGSS